MSPGQWGQRSVFLAVCRRLGAFSIPGTYRVLAGHSLPADTSSQRGSFGTSTQNHPRTSPLCEADGAVTRIAVPERGRTSG